MADKEKSQKGIPGEDGIDYKLEGADPGEEKTDDPTDEGYDEAAHSGSSRYAIPSGEGGVFGTTGGGGTGEGFQVIERPGIYNREEKAERNSTPTIRIQKETRHVQVTFDHEEKK